MNPQPRCPFLIRPLVCVVLFFTAAAVLFYRCPHKDHESQYDTGLVGTTYQRRNLDDLFTRADFCRAKVIDSFGVQGSEVSSPALHPDHETRALPTSGISTQPELHHRNGMAKCKEDDHQEHHNIPEQFSNGFQKAKLRDKICFLYHHVLECSSDGIELIIACHDIIISMPEGAVTEGESIRLEVGVAMFGPFNFTGESQPISPILWLCFLDDDFELKKPIRVTLPHFLTGIARNELWDHHVTFSKANHRDSEFEGGSIFYRFKPMEGDISVDFISSGGKSYGVLETYHCCFLCIEAKKSPQLLTDATYCLVRIESSCPPRNEIHFATTYFLKTCLKALKEQYPNEDGFKIARHKEFKFKREDTGQYYTQDPLKITILEDEELYTLGLEPASAEIYPDDINFWKEKYEDMLLRHETKMYPPRVIVTVVMKTSVAVPIPVTFSGCENNHKLDTTLTFPLGITTPGVVSTSHTEDMKEKVNLRNVFRKLLPLAHEWKSIATFLNVPESVSNRVAKDEKGVNDCLREVLAYRINKMDHPPLTLSELADATDPFDKSIASELRKIN